MLVVIGPNGSYKEIYAGDVLERYGPVAYPFTRKRAAKLRELTLDTFLDTKVFLRRGTDGVLASVGPYHAIYFYLQNG